MGNCNIRRRCDCWAGGDVVEQVRINGDVGYYGLVVRLLPPDERHMSRYLSTLGPLLLLF